MSIHGGRGDDMRVTQGGLSLGTNLSGGAKSSNTYNMGAVQEVAVDTGAVNAELGQGGIRINLISKDGGNTFKGTLVATFANSAMQGSNSHPDGALRLRQLHDSLDPAHELHLRQGLPTSASSHYHLARCPIPKESCLIHSSTTPS